MEKYKDVKIGEEIATLNVFKKKSEFLPCNEVEEYEYNGKMLQCGVGTKYKIRFCLTSSNKMLAYDSDDPCHLYFYPLNILWMQKKRYLSVNVVNKFKSRWYKICNGEEETKIFLEGNDFVLLAEYFMLKLLYHKKIEYFTFIPRRELLQS